MYRLNIVLEFLRAFATDQRGAAAAEYVMILAIVGTGLFMAVFLLSGASSGGFEDAAEVIDEAGCNNQEYGTGDGAGLFFIDPGNAPHRDHCPACPSWGSWHRWCATSPAALCPHHIGPSVWPSDTVQYDHISSKQAEPWRRGTQQGLAIHRAWHVRNGYGW